MITFYIYPPQDYYDLKQEVLDELEVLKVFVHINIKLRD